MSISIWMTLTFLSLIVLAITVFFYIKAYKTSLKSSMLIEKFKNENLILKEHIERLYDEKNNFEKRLAQEVNQAASRVLEEKSTSLNLKANEGLSQIISPIEKELKDLRNKVQETYEKDLKDRVSLETELKNLVQLNQVMSQEAANLTRALKGDQKQQGNWGEFLLESILEKSGLRKGQEYQVQESKVDEEGKLKQPDVVVYLPEQRIMIIDSKVSLVAFEKCVNLEDKSLQEIEGKAHVRSLKSHIQSLSSKSYHDLYPEQSLDFVLLFIPIEPAFALALQLDNGLFQEAFDKGVLLVSPSTLLATLRTVANIWRHEKQNKNTLEIARQGGALYDKVSILYKDLEVLGKQLNTANMSYEKVFKGFGQGKGNLIGRVEKLKELGAKTSKSLPANLSEDSEDF